MKYLPLCSSCHLEIHPGDKHELGTDILCGMCFERITKPEESDEDGAEANPDRGADGKIHHTRPE